MQLVARSILASILLMSYNPEAQALDFSLHKNNSRNLLAIYATGPILSGDASQLSVFLKRHPQRSNVAIYLASSGGNLYEGMRLGLFFRDNGIKTVVEGGYDCASACAVAFLGGRDRYGRIWRSSSDNSRLGFHAFRGIKNMAISPNQVQLIVADLLRYGRAVDAPIELLIAGFETPSESMFWVSNRDICALGIKLWSNRTNPWVCNN